MSTGAKSIFAVVGLGVFIWWLGSGPAPARPAWERKR